MRNLSNPIVEALSVSLLDQKPYLSRIGYSVRLKDGTVKHLLPQFDSVGFGASVGDEVEVSSIGLGIHATVIRKVKGYSSQSCEDISL